MKKTQESESEELIMKQANRRGLRVKVIVCILILIGLSASIFLKLDVHSDVVYIENKANSTYANETNMSKDLLLSKEEQKKIKKSYQLTDVKSKGDSYDLTYSLNEKSIKINLMKSSLSKEKNDYINSLINSNEQTKKTKEIYSEYLSSIKSLDFLSTILIIISISALLVFIIKM